MRERETSTTRRTIDLLLVEDDRLWQQLVTKSLEMPARTSAEFALDTVGTLADAADRLEHGRYDAILLDLGLPDSFGLATYDSIRQFSGETPVIILTGNDDEQAGMAAIRSGAGDYLTKGENSFRNVLIRSILYTVERQHSAERIRQSERNLRNVIDASTDGILVVDRSCSILFANKAAEKVLASSLEQLIGSRFDYPVSGGKTREIEVTGGNGKSVTVEMRVRLIEWQGRSAFLVTLCDITTRRATERKLREYRENLRSLVAEKVRGADAEKELLSVTFSSMGDGVIVVDPQRRVIFFNHIAEILAGWDFEPVQDRSISRLMRVVDERTGKDVEDVIDKVIACGKTVTGGEFDVLVGLDGREKPISIVAAPVLKNDETVGVVIVLRDVSKDRQLDRMKEDFISSVSHELRTPLTSIKAYTETIIEDPEMDEATKAEFLAIINEESDRLSHLIESLLEISRLESGRAALNIKPVDVVELIRKVSVALRPLASKKSIELKTELPGSVPLVEADACKIESVITNLANNAVKFTETSGTVIISAEVRGDHLCLRVTDTGMGISAEDLPQIFHRFYRVGESASRVPGTGLGLAIVKRIVDMHGGTIKVQSRLGEGTTFSVLLPISREVDEAAEVVDKSAFSQGSAAV